MAAFDTFIEEAVPIIKKAIEEVNRLIKDAHFEQVSIWVSLSELVKKHNPGVTGHSFAETVLHPLIEEYEKAGYCRMEVHTLGIGGVQIETY